MAFNAIETPEEKRDRILAESLAELRAAGFGGGGQPVDPQAVEAAKPVEAATPEAPIPPNPYQDKISQAVGPLLLAKKGDGYPALGVPREFTPPTPGTNIPQEVLAQNAESLGINGSVKGQPASKLPEYVQNTRLAAQQVGERNDAEKRLAGVALKGPPAELSYAETHRPEAYFNRDATGLGLHGDVHTYGAPSNDNGGSSGGSGLGGGGDTGRNIAMFLDLFMNNGRNAKSLMAPDPNQLTPLEARKLQLEERRLNNDDRMTDANVYRLTHPEAKDPRGYELAQERLTLAQERLKLQSESAARELAKQQALAKLGTPETKEAQDAAIAAGVPEQTARRMTGAQLTQWRPQLGQGVQQTRSNTAWQSRNDITEQQAKDAEIRKYGRELTKEERDREAKTIERGQDFAQQYGDKLGTELTIAGLIQDIEETPGGAPPAGFLERFRNAITARGIDPARLEAWQSKHLILEYWSREKSGAAISNTEEGKFVTQVGMDPAASPEQVEAAYKVLNKVVGRTLRSRATPNRESAREVVMDAMLDPDRWLGPAKANPRVEVPKPPAGDPEVPTPNEPEPINEDAKHFKITLPDGSVYADYLTPTEIKKALAGNAKLEAIE